MTATGPPDAPAQQPPVPTEHRAPVEHRYWVRAQILSIIEIPLLLLLAYAFASQTGAPYTLSGSSSDQFAPLGGTTGTSIFGPDPPLYFSAFLWLATAAVFAAAVLIGFAFWKQRLSRLRLLILGNAVAAVAAAVGVIGDIFLRSVWTWTTTNSDGSSIAPTTNGVIAEIILAIGVAIAAAVLPLAVGLVLRRHGPAAHVTI